MTDIDVGASTEGVFPRRARSGKMSDFTPKTLAGMHAYDLGTGDYLGKILGTNGSEIVLSGGGRVDIKNSKKYFVMENPPPQQG
jgi:hypothetical protein